MCGGFTEKRIGAFSVEGTQGMRATGFQELIRQSRMKFAQLDNISSYALDVCGISNDGETAFIVYRGNQADNLRGSMPLLARLLTAQHQSPSEETAMLRTPHAFSRSTDPNGFTIRARFCSGLAHFDRCKPSPYPLCGACSDIRSSINKRITSASDKATAPPSKFEAHISIADDPRRVLLRLETLSTENGRLRAKQYRERARAYIERDGSGRNVTAWGARCAFSNALGKRIAKNGANCSAQDEVDNEPIPGARRRKKKRSALALSTTKPLMEEVPARPDELGQCNSGSGSGVCGGGGDSACDFGEDGKDDRIGINGDESGLAGLDSDADFGSDVEGDEGGTASDEILAHRK
jgi:hypothetical protein